MLHVLRTLPGVSLVSELAATWALSRDRSGIAAGDPNRYYDPNFLFNDMANSFTGGVGTAAVVGFSEAMWSVSHGIPVPPDYGIFLAGFVGAIGGLLWRNLSTPFINYGLANRIRNASDSSVLIDSAALLEARDPKEVAKALVDFLKEASVLNAAGGRANIHQFREVLYRLNAIDLEETSDAFDDLRTTWSQRSATPNEREKLAILEEMF